MGRWSAKPSLARVALWALLCSTGCSLIVGGEPSVLDDTTTDDDATTDDDTTTGTDRGDSFMLTVTIVGAGRVTSMPAGIDCPGTCVVPFTEGTTVELDVEPGEGGAFINWSGDCTTQDGESPDCSLAMDQDRAVTATFSGTGGGEVGVTVDLVGDAAGNVGSNIGLQCPGTCSVNVASGQNVSLAVEGMDGIVFGGFFGAGCFEQYPACSFQAAGDSFVTAAFCDDGVELPHGQQPVVAVDITAAGDEIVTATPDAVRFWTSGGGGPTVVPAPLEEIQAGLLSVAAQGRLVATVGAAAPFIAVVDREFPGSPTIIDHGPLAGTPVEILFDPGADRIALANGPEVWVFNPSGAGNVTRLQGHDLAITDIAFSPDGSRIATASLDGTARVFNANGLGTPVVFDGHTGPVRSVAFDAAGSRVVSGADDTTARVWSAVGDVGEAIIPLPSSVISVAFGPGGERIAARAGAGVYLASADGGGTPQVFASDSEVGVRFAGKRLIYVNGGRVVVYALEDSDQPLGIPLQQPIAESGILFSMAASASGTRFVAAGDSGTFIREGVCGQAGAVQ